MITAFIILMIMVFGKIGVVALKAAWGLTKVLLTVVLLPIILIGMVVEGLVYLALPILVFIGLYTIVKSVVRA